jgi:hypothetical protein
MTADDLVVPPSSANQAIKIDDEEVLLHRGTVIPTEISLQGFPQSDGIGENHVHLSLDRVPQGRVLFQGLDKVVTEQSKHQKVSS